MGFPLLLTGRVCFGMVQNEKTRGINSGLIGDACNESTHSSTSHCSYLHLFFAIGD